MGFTPRQQEIMSVATKLIAQEGIENLTTKNIAREIALSEAAIYRHFESKMDILVGILSSFEENAKKLLEFVDNLNLTGMEKLFRILKTRCDRFVEDPATMVVILSEELFPQNSKLSQKVYGIMQMNQKSILKIIEESQKNGEIRKDVDKFALFYMIVGPFRLMVNRWRLSNFSFDLTQEFLNFWGGLEKMIRVG